jgi:SpoIID/LytB domain protein
MNRKKYRFYSFILLLIFSALSVYGAAVFDPEPQNPLSEAVSLYYQGNLQVALQILAQYLKQNPADCVAHLNLIRLLCENGQLNDALTEIQHLLELNPNNPNYRLILLRTAYLAGKTELVIQTAATIEPGAERQQWLGLALADQGRDQEAVQALESSLANQPFNPTIYYMLGLIYLKNSNFEKAQDYFLRALAQEPNFTIVNLPLAQTYLALEKYQKAYRLLLNGKAILPWDRFISAALQKLTAAHPELIKQKQEMTEKNRQIAIPPQMNPILKDRDTIPEIRIGLVEKIKQLDLKTGDIFTITSRDGSKYYTGTGGAILEIQINNGRIIVCSKNGTILFSTDRGITLSYKNAGATTILFDVEYGAGSFWAGRQDRIYRGFIELLPGKEGITVINRLNVEEYLYSVVASEMSPSWPASALEAQAIAARTYTFANIGQYESQGFDLWGTVISQAYDGVSAETPSTRAAVDATRGEILTYNGKPIAAFFTGNSGGYTENSRDIWNFSLPYLQAVPDPMLSPRNLPLPPEDLAGWLGDRPETYSSQPKYSSRSSYRWTLWIPRIELESRLNLGDKLGHIISIITTGRGKTGVVKQVLIKGTSGEYLVKSDSIRSKLGGLRSNLFVVEPKLGADGLVEYFIFTGAGWGHGVGMCQSGAAGMAAAGFSNEKILLHYYPGTILEKKY